MPCPGTVQFVTLRLDRETDNGAGQLAKRLNAREIFKDQPVGNGAADGVTIQRTGAGGETRTLDLGIMRTAGSIDWFGKSWTLLYFSTSYNRGVLIGLDAI